MWNWILRALGLAEPPPLTDGAGRTASGAADVPGGAARPGAERASAPTADAGPRLSEDQIQFLQGLVAPPDPLPLDEFRGPDRLFLGGVAKRLRTRELDMAVMPEGALRLAELMRRGDQPMARYVELVDRDPALSVEVLKAANAAYYAASVRTSSLHEAIMRLGLTRLQSVLVLAHLKGRVMKGGPFQSKAELVLDLALPTGFLAAHIARLRGGSAETAFMRGMLMHVEHLLILAAIPDISREHRASISPSTPALLQGFVRFGPEIRCAVTKLWKLSDVLVSDDDERGQLEFAALRQGLVDRWIEGDEPTVGGIAIAFEELMARVTAVPDLAKGSAA